MYFVYGSHGGFVEMKCGETVLVWAGDLLMFGLFTAEPGMDELRAEVSSEFLAANV